jgi:hypothetical protein
MKKLNFLVILALFVGLFSSCKKDETTTADPTISFQNGTTSLVFSGTNSIDVNITFMAEGKISSVTLVQPTTTGNQTSDITGEMGQAGTDNGSGTTSSVYFFKVSSTQLATLLAANNGALTYTFTLLDQANKSTTAIFTVSLPVVPPTSYTNVTIGSYNNTTIGSSFASSDGQVYSLSSAKTNSNKIDFIYYYSSVNNASISAPADLTLLNTYFTTASAPSTWTVKNNTKLSKVNTFAFANCTKAQINALTPTGLNVTNLVANDIIAFQTDANSFLPNIKGVAQVVSVSGTDAGTIVLNIKIAN